MILITISVLLKPLYLSYLVIPKICGLTICFCKKNYSELRFNSLQEVSTSEFDHIIETQCTIVVFIWLNLNAHLILVCRKWCCSREQKLFQSFNFNCQLIYRNLFSYYWKKHVSACLCLLFSSTSFLDQLTPGKFLLRAEDRTPFKGAILTLDSLPPLFLFQLLLQLRL